MAVFNSFKVVIDNYPEGQVEHCYVPNNMETKPYALEILPMANINISKEMTSLKRNQIVNGKDYRLAMSGVNVRLFH